MEQHTHIIHLAGVNCDERYAGSENQDELSLSAPWRQEIVTGNEPLEVGVGAARSWTRPPGAYAV